MAQLISFIDRLEEKNCKNPYELGYNFTFNIAATKASALSFIKDYMNFQNVSPIYCALMAGYLSSSQYYNNFGMDVFDAYAKGSLEHICECNTLSENIVLDKQELVDYFNLTVNRFENIGLGAQQITDVLITHYIGMFVKFFNENMFQRMFLSKNEILRRERLKIFNDSKQSIQMRNLLENAIKYPNARLYFLSVNLIDNWRAELIIN